MQLAFTPDRRNVLFVPETTAEDTILTAFPALYKVRGERFAPAFPSILQNIVKRLKKKIKTVTTKEKDIVDLLKKNRPCSRFLKPLSISLPRFAIKSSPSDFSILGAVVVCCLTPAWGKRRSFSITLP